MSGKITFANAMKENMESYGKEVNFNRAIVDISGLKRVQLRILYTMYKMKLLPDKKYGKSPDIIGNVIKIHPHSDSSIYDALVRMGQPWTLNYPLIDFKGNVGTEDGDPAAASRYTEARLSKYGYMLIDDIENSSPFVTDYADNGMEPEYLVPAFPALFVNISKGIGVAAACNFLPHTVESIAKVIEQYMNDVPEDEILADLFPVFPTGGILVNGADLPLIYKAGRGSVKLRAKHTVVGNKIIFTELPYQVSRTNVIDVIQEWKDERILSIYDTSDMSQKSITVEARSIANIPSLLSSLFANTRLEDTFSVNMTIHNRENIGLHSFLSLISEYIKQQHGRIISIAQAKIEIAAKKSHELEGFISILSDIDRALMLIKVSRDRASATEALKTEFKITDLQVKAVLALKLSQLTKRGVSDIEAELEELSALIANYTEISTKEELRNIQILEEVSSIPPSKEFTMEILMENSKHGATNTERALEATNGDELILNDNDEVLVVTIDKRGHRIKGKDIDRLPNTEIVLMHTQEWIEAQPYIELFGIRVDPSTIIFQCRSTRGGNMRL